MNRYDMDVYLAHIWFDQFYCQFIFKRYDVDCEYD